MDFVAYLFKCLSVFLFSMIKFIGGPASGIAFGLNLLETILLSVLGMMTSVFIFSYVGVWFKNHISPKIFKNKVLFSSKTRKIVAVWRRFGLKGVAFLTPIIFSPIIGTMVAVSFRETPKRIFLYMLLSATFWGVTLSFLLKSIGDKITV